MAHSTHHDEIRRALVGRRRELMTEIHGNLRDARSEASGPHPYAVESGDTSEVHPEEELAFALIQLKGQVLTKINEAVRRIDEGTYGLCGDCGDVIAEPRLRALPFAVRCKECEELREQVTVERRTPARSREEWRQC